MSLIDRINANPLPFAQLLGIEFLSAEADALAARMLIRPELCTMGGVAHGGAIMSFADTLGAAAAFINLRGRRQGDDDAREQDQFHRRRAGRLDGDRPHDAHPSRQADPGLANARRDRRGEAGRARRADADEPLSGPARFARSK